MSVVLVSKGEHTVTHQDGPTASGTEFVSWELTRAWAPCDAPPALPPAPEESEPSDDDQP